MIKYEELKVGNYIYKPSLENFIHVGRLDFEIYEIVELKNPDDELMRSFTLKKLVTTGISGETFVRDWEYEMRLYYHTKKAALSDLVTKAGSRKYGSLDYEFLHDLKVAVVGLVDGSVMFMHNAESKIVMDNDGNVTGRKSYK